MTSNGSTYEHLRKDEPEISRRLARVTSPIYRFFDKLFHSHYNPIYRSGTIAIAMFVVLIVTGTYLLCFYKVSAPYESLSAINSHIFLGKLLRSIHRYATDVAIIAALFHMLQIAIQGKTWGPRSLAWISGILMLGLFFASAWSGYVMVWDTHGQLVAQAGAELMKVIPLIKEPVSEAFNGEAPLPPSFFFMNLFLHVALPLMIGLGLWVHTAKIKRTQWLPPPFIFRFLMVAIIVVSALIPAPLLERANLLKIVGNIPIDIVTGFWIPMLSSVSPEIVLGSLIALTIVSLLVPLWWRPKITYQGRTSIVDTAACTGCTQCAIDCPYEAISMVPSGSGKRLLAVVAESNCVSCGICSASCSDFAIGPPSRCATDQAEAARLFRDSNLTQPLDVLVAYCSNNPCIAEGLEKLKPLIKVSASFFPLQCTGTIHNATLSAFLEYSRHVVIWGCPERVCMNRDGITLLKGRYQRTRVPFFDKNVDRTRASLVTLSSWEVNELSAHINQRGLIKHSSPKLKRAKAVAFGSVFTMACAYSSLVPAGESPTKGILRVAGTLSTTVRTNCRPLTVSEKASLPLHMQRPQICEEEHASYNLNINIDGKDIHQSEVSPAGLHHDRPIYLNEEITIAPGQHDFIIKLTPAKTDVNAPGYTISRSLNVEAGSVYLFVPDTKTHEFKLMM